MTIEYNPPQMPNIKLKKDCLIIQISKDNIYILRKDCILGYRVSDYYLTVYTNIPKVDICIEYTRAEAEQFMKHAEILQSILSPDVQPSADLLGL